MFSFFQRCCRQTKVQFRAFVCPELVVLTAAVVDAPPLILQTFCSLNNAEGARSYCVSALKAHRFPPFVNWKLCFLLLICVTVQWSGNKKRHVVSPTVVDTVLLLWFRFIHSPRFLTKLNPSCESYRGTVFLRSDFIVIFRLFCWVTGRFQAGKTLLELHHNQYASAYLELYTGLKPYEYI